MEKATEFSLKGQEAIIKTRAAFLWTQILRAPFWAIYNLLLFILYKELHATPFQIALFIALKPVVSLFSVYWSSSIHLQRGSLLSNIVWAGIIGYIPFLFVPFFYNAWFMIFASALFMTMHRGVVPAWMEIFKKNLPGEAKQKIFSYGSIVSHVVGSLLPLIIGPLLDRYAFCWRWVFLVTALLGIGAIFSQLRMPLPPSQESQKEPANHFFAPWTSSWRILKEHPHFRTYQLGFMIFGGCGLMILQPALPRFFIDILGMSYTELSIALILCKGVGFALTSQLWASWMHRTPIFKFSSLVTFLGALFPLILLLAQLHSIWVYVAYFIYGIMQAGSELSWHLSGPIFAKEEDSLPFSTLNVLTVGLRGCVIPQIGALLCVGLASPYILILGALSCFVGCYWMLSLRIARKPLSQQGHR